MKSSTDTRLIADRIKILVSVPDALKTYGYKTSRSGRIPCMLHGGTHNNFSYKETHFNCFVCGASGSVIDFAMHLFGLNFLDACHKLDSDFHLGLFDDDISPVLRQQVNEAIKKKREQELRREQHENNYKDLLMEYRMLKDKLKTACPPFLFEDGSVYWDKDYCDTMNRLDVVEWKLDKEIWG